MTNIHFRNANVVLDGFAALQKGFDVLVKDNYIDAVSSIPIDPAGATVITTSTRYPRHPSTPRVQRLLISSARHLCQGLSMPTPMSRDSP